MSKKGIEELKKEYEEIRMSDAQVDAFRKSIERGKKDNRKKKMLRVWKNAGTVAAAVLIAFIILPNTSAGVAHAMGQIPLIGNVVKVVTFRDYSYNSETQIANIEVPELETEEIVVGGGEIAPAKLTEENSAVYDGSDNETVALKLEETVDEMNRDIELLTSQIIADFEEEIKEENVVKEVLVSHETVATPERYFTLKLNHYEASADGAETIYYYTIDLQTGERLQLKDLFADDADYIGVISEEIIRQMQEQMAADANTAYWLDEEFEELNFKEITEDTQFYINENNNVVISFNEGDVAPMYMGVVTFEIPAETLREIRK